MEEKRVRKLTFRDFGVTGRHDISSFIAPSEGAILGITEKEDLPEIMEHMLSIVKGYSTCFVYDLDHVLHVVSHSAICSCSTQFSAVSPEQMTSGKSPSRLRNSFSLSRGVWAPVASPVTQTAPQRRFATCRSSPRV